MGIISAIFSPIYGAINALIGIATGGAGGTRITESGDTRITEAGDIRILE